jgi:parvulin-like peptidyl-prolyl isomerase
MNLSWKKSRKLVLMVIAVVFVAVTAGAAIAEDESPIVSVAGEKVGEQELLNLVVRQSGVQKQMMPFVLAQMSLEQREELVDQVVTALLLSQAAMMEGLHLDEEIAMTIRWNRANTLAQAYINKVAQGWSFKQEDLREYYDEHKEDYIVPKQAHVRHILAETEQEASNILLEVLADEEAFNEVAREKSIDTGSAQKGGDLGWISPGQTVPAFDELVFSMKENSIKGPVESRFGWHVVQVLEKKPSHQKTFEEALPQIREDIQQWYLAAEVEKLKDRFDVKIDTEALSNLGGFPARNQE